LESRKAVIVTAKSEDFLLKLRDALGLTMTIHKKKGSFNASICHDLVIKRVDLYRQLTEIGLTPRKSATIGPLGVPDKGFPDFLRGVIDGDGCIRRWKHPTNGREQWELKIVGISRPFLEWISNTVERTWHVSGRIHVQRDERRKHPLYKVKYGKLAARVIFSKCYRPGTVALERKRILAQKCILSTVGWSKSKTVEDRKDWRGWKYQRAQGVELISRVLDRKEAASPVVPEIVHC